jgi:phosphoheptose isomerase
VASISLGTENLEIVNDYGYQYIFLGEFETLAKPEDILMGIMASRKSRYIIKGVDAVREIGLPSLFQ